MCVSNLTIIGSDNGLSPGRHQAIIWTSDKIVLIGSLGINFSDILIENHIFSLKKYIWNVVYEIASILSRPLCVDISYYLANSRIHNTFTNMDSLFSQYG